MFQSVAPREVTAVVAIVALAAALAFALPRSLPTVQAGENWLQDFRFGALAHREPQNSDIVVVAITEDTMATLSYRSPLDRGFLAAVVSAVAAAKPRAIGIDVLFDQPTEPAKDTLLRKTLVELPVPVVVARAAEADGLTEAQSTYLRNFTEGMATGLAGLLKDRADGTVRWIFAGRKADGRHEPGMVPALAAAGGVPAPKDDVPLVLRHGPDPGTPAFRLFPAHLVAVLPKAWLEGKFVLIGADLPLDDRHRTAFAAAMGVRGGTIPGVVIFAHALAQVLDGRTLPVTGPVATAVLLVVVAGLGVLFAALDMALFLKGVLCAAALALLWVGGFAAYAYGGVMIPLMAPTIGFLASAGAGTAYLGKRDREQKKFIRDAFAHYVSPAIVDELTQDPEHLALGGERRELTYLFTDLANFTAFTERTDPAILVPLLNEYLSGMCGILFKHGATIDKIVGDAVVGFFNAPVAQPDHAQRAVAAALEMDAFGQRFVEDRAAQGLDIGITRIGVHSGSAVIGNFGGEQFFDYTAHGDMVNTAARLEGANKYLGTRVCISGATAGACDDTRFRPVGALVLKGKTEGLEVFEPLSDGAVDSPATAAYRKAFGLLVEGDPSAIDGFRRALELNPGDGLAKLHLKRLENGETGATIVMESK